MSIPLQQSKVIFPHHTGQIIAVYGRHYTVETTNGEALSCVMRGKKGGVACGDQVEIKFTTPGQGVIEKILLRKSLLYRSDAFKEKIIAANVTQIIIVVAAVPGFSEELINRCLVAAESQRIQAIIVLNKTDLAEPTKAAIKELSLYESLGYPLIKISAVQDISALKSYLQGHVSVLAGQSGMGKSTILNALIPEAQRATAEISVALNSGCHTTTHAHLYHIDANSDIIDSPGIQAFGLNHIGDENLAWGFTEFHPYIGQCKFNDCRHVNEPGCMLIQATSEKKISTKRFNFYHKLLQK
ncbi:ribosome small subunit-dependent GTPase A [Nitrosomonas aestuarii]|uniref:ribosome small subunit-dependent GTPase A n=1 Tax=Nitrosomonas aestuarii TaxID=52441 RepID=UPI001FD3BA3E|nr:ribosome small subunit-dependent GTPase A [Nitrosomonas aestuarii]